MARVHGVHDEKPIWFEVELQGAHGDREAEVFQVSNDDPAVVQRRLEDKQPEEKRNTDCLVKEQEKEYPTGWKIKTGTGLMQVLQGVEFEVEPQDDHTFEVEPHGNVDHVELFSYKEDNNEAAFAVAAVEKIESLTFNNTIACEVISKWKAELKDDMDARSDAEIWATKDLLDKEKENILGMEIVKDQSGNTLRVSQSRFYNRKLVQTFLEGHSILSLKGSLSEDCNVEKNGKWSCIYEVGSQEYQMVCTRHGIALVDVDQSQATYMTLTEDAKETIWLKGLAIESGFELKMAAGIATGALSKVIPSLRFQYWLKLLRIGEG
ncbi:hypothetical protein Tco_1022051 [Tanacetum coccineum]